MLITHDMGVIAETAQRVAVMYAGRIAEIGPVRSVIHAPSHPYTVGLMRSIPESRAQPARAWRRSTAPCRVWMRSRPAARSIRVARSASSAATASVPVWLRPATGSRPAGCMRNDASR